MRQPRLPKPDSSRIVVDSLETKKVIIAISEKTGESLKEIIIRLVDQEHKKIRGIKH
jgi:hypothetical protein